MFDSRNFTRLKNPDTEKMASARLEGGKIIVFHTRPAWPKPVEVEKEFNNYRTARRYCKRKGFTDLVPDARLDIARRLT